MAARGWGHAAEIPGASPARYSLGVMVTVLAVLSQYFVPTLVPATQGVYGNLAGDLLVVYGIPVVAFALLVGVAPLSNWRDRMGLAVWRGLAWYGGISVVSIGVAIVLGILYLALDPSAYHLLERANPALEQARSNPWFYVALSFLVGACEETIFRGWIFGYWRDRPGSWLLPATWTSAVFAGVHLYYGLTYGAASPIYYSALFLTGFAFAAVYRLSGGNLVVPALLHGAHDAGAYLTLISEGWGLVLEYGVILVGLVFALVEFVRTEERPLSTVAGPPGSSG